MVQIHPGPPSLTRTVTSSLTACISVWLRGQIQRRGNQVFMATARLATAWRRILASQVWRDSARPPPYAVRPHARTSTSYRHSAPWCSLCSGNRLSAVGFIRAEIRAFWIMQVAYRTLPAALVSAVSSAAASWQGLHNLSPSVAGDGHGKGCPCCLLVHRQFSIGATPSVEILFAQV